MGINYNSNPLENVLRKRRQIDKKEEDLMDRIRVIPTTLFLQTFEQNQYEKHLEVEEERK